MEVFVFCSDCKMIQHGTKYCTVMLLSNSKYVDQRIPSRFIATWVLKTLNTDEKLIFRDFNYLVVLRSIIINIIFF